MPTDDPEGATASPTAPALAPTLSLRPMMSSLPGLRLPGTSAAETGETVTTPQGQARAEVPIEEDYAAAESSRLGNGKHSLLVDCLNISNVLTDGAAALVDDSFLRCFNSNNPDPWNWNIYLLPAWCLGVLVRYCLLFPFRLLFLLLNNLLFFAIFFPISYYMKESPRKQQIERRMVQYLCGCFLASWSAVVRYHGPRPTPAVNRIWVSNHSSIIDYVILCSYSPFSVVMQLHNGWMAFLQTRVLNSLHCLWFNRNEVSDRLLASKRMKDHVNDASKLPLLIFPEGTCVNNEYMLMFKRGAFDLGATVCPVAIKYNKIFVDASWNSKKQSFLNNLFKLMMSWAVVCDVYFLEPQTKGPDESADAFATRVQHMIATTANLRIVPWDGYLKYYNLAEKRPQLVEKRRKVVADVLRTHLPASSAQRAAKAAAPAPAADAAEAVPSGEKKAQ